MQGQRTYYIAAFGLYHYFCPIRSPFAAHSQSIRRPFAGHSYAIRMPFSAKRHVNYGLTAMGTRGGFLVLGWTIHRMRTRRACMKTRQKKAHGSKAQVVRGVATWLAVFQKPYPLLSPANALPVADFRASVLRAVGYLNTRLNTGSLKHKGPVLRTRMNGVAGNRIGDANAAIAAPKPSSYIGGRSATRPGTSLAMLAWGVGGSACEGNK